MELTPYGSRAIAAYLDHERSRRRLLAELEAHDPEAPGKVRLSAPGFLAYEVLVPALGDFLARHPYIAVQMDGTSRVADLTRDEADVAVHLERPAQHSLALCKAGKLGLTAYASTSYLEQRGGLTAPGSLRGHDVVSYDPRLSLCEQLQWWGLAVPEARLLFTANDAVALRDAACKGLGIALLPHFLGDEAEPLQRIEGAFEEVVDLWVVWRAEQRQVRRVRAVVGFLVALIGSQSQRLCRPNVTAEH